MKGRLPVFAMLFSLLAGCAMKTTPVPEPTPTAAPEPAVRLHYLGHASFVLLFDNGLTVLIDYGTSNSYGLDSPIHDLSGDEPDLVIYSHSDPDHDRQAVFKTAKTLTRDQSFSQDGLEISAIPTSERTKSPDNFSHLFAYKGLKVLHLADAQYLIQNIGRDDVRQRVKELYPDTYDLLLMTIDGPTEMEKEAAEFAALLGPQRMIPMHYWGVAHRNTFLDGLRSLGGFAITAQTGAEFILYTHQSAEPVQVIPLEPAPFELVR